MKKQEQSMPPRQVLEVLDQHAIVSATDDHGRISYVNDKFVEISGYSREELIGQTHKVINSGFHPPEFFASMWETISGGQVWTGEVRNRHKDGSYYWVKSTVAPTFDLSGQSNGYISIRTDITDVKQAELLQQSFLALDYAVSSFFVVWPDTLKLLYLNKSALEEFGFPDEESIAGLRLPDLNTAGRFQHENFEEGVFRELIAPLLAGETARICYETESSFGVPLEVRIEMIAPEGTDPRLVIIFRDITERKEIERRKSEFVSTVSHELRTPLTSIKGALDIIGSGAIGELPAAIENVLGIARRNSDRLADLVNDLLDFQKLDADLMEFTQETINLAKLLDQAIENNREYAAQYNVVLNPEPFDEHMYVTGDEHRLLQVMDNLLSNAVKFSDGSNSVEISTKIVNEHVTVSVTDHGIGIPESAQERLFDRFSQADASTTRQHGGTGLGLSIAKSIVEKSGGRLSFDSTVGEGSCFYFDLPLLTDHSVE